MRLEDKLITTVECSCGWKREITDLELNYEGPLDVRFLVKKHQDECLESNNNDN